VIVCRHILVVMSHGSECSRDILVTVDDGCGTYRETAGRGDAGVA
jgi:hypothetical protein